MHAYEGGGGKQERLLQVNTSFYCSMYIHIQSLHKLVKGKEMANFIPRRLTFIYEKEIHQLVLVETLHWPLREFVSIG